MNDPRTAADKGRGLATIVGHVFVAAGICCLALVPVPGVAQAPPAASNVVLKNFKFVPRRIELVGQVPIVLRLQNISSSGHSFVAPEFFSAAKLDPATAGLVNNGRVEVPPHAIVVLKLTPMRGNYALKCGHSMHALFGMAGSIVVR